MNKTLIFLILATGTVVLSIIILSVGPMTNKIHGAKWGALNCGILSDQANLLKDEVTKLKKLKNLCHRQKAMHDMEYTSFIINIILGFISADLALIHYLGFGKEFEVKIGIIGFISGIIGFILALVYVCYSGYIFTNDVAFQEILINGNSFDYTGTPITKLYSDGAIYKWDGNQYIAEYENDRDEFSNYIRYKDLGKSQYNYDSDYFKKYYFDTNNEIILCHFNEVTFSKNSIQQKSDSSGNCVKLYNEPKETIENKTLYNKWLTALIFSCFVLACDLALSFFGFLIFSNFGQNGSAS